MKRFAFILALIALASCEIHFELDKASDPVMYVQYLPSSEIDAKIMVAYAEPAFDKPAAQAHPFNVSDVTVTVNGAAAVVTEDAEQGSWNRHILHVKAHSAIKPGDEIKVEVSGKDVPTASASTVVPERPQIKSITFTKDEKDSTDVWKVVMKLGKPVQEGEYYGIKAVKYSEWYTAYGEDMFHYQIDTIANTEYFNPGQLADFADLNSLDLDNYASISYQDGFMRSELFMGEGMTLLTSRQIEGDTYTFYVNAVDSFVWSEFDFDFDLPDMGDDYDYPLPDEPDIPDDTEEEEPEEPEPEFWMYLGEKSQFRFEIYRLSEEFYNYAKAQYLSTFNMLSNFGVIPPNFTYTNVRGGIGIVAGISGVGTQWIIPPEPEKE